MVVNLQEAASIIGKSVNTLKSWFRQGCPGEKSGGEWHIHIPSVIEWRESRAVQNAIGDTQTADADELKQRKLAAETAIAEIEAAKARGEVLEIEAVVKTITNDYITLKQRLRQVAQRLAPLVVGETDELEVKKTIGEEIDDALTELSNEYCGESGDPIEEDNEP